MMGLLPICCAEGSVVLDGDNDKDFLLVIVASDETLSALEDGFLVRYIVPLVSIKSRLYNSYL